MFVGDVRCAVVGCGVSWKLSGGSECDSGPMNVVKYLHVRRAMSRSVCASPADNSAYPLMRPGRLIQRATAGDAAQMIANGSAIGRAMGCRHATSAAAATASTTAPPSRR